MSADYDFERDEPAIVASLSEVEARALLTLIEMGSREITRKLDAGEYPHECQQQIARAVLGHGAWVSSGILGVLAKRDRAPS